MIAGLSKAVILYLAPLLTLTAILLSIFAFLSPVVLLHDRVALLTVTPFSQAGSSQTVDGPSIFLGVLGTIARPAPTDLDLSIRHRILFARK